MSTPAAFKQDPTALWRPLRVAITRLAGIAFAGKRAGQPLGLTAVHVHAPDVSATRIGDFAAIGRPGEARFTTGGAGQRNGPAAFGGNQGYLAFANERDRLAVGREGRVSDWLNRKEIVQGEAMCRGLCESN